ncbi:YfbM family protein [Dactylosporangium sp. NPDC005572]|uniref:YfbM family protein n=1 Tax=Dactylosporangium sp. NPDC005572 TaxID=3156889 RepID=UPI0033A09BD7
MACRGMFFALTGDQEAALMATRDDDEVRALVEEIEMGDWDGEPLDCETDKAWDAMHRCLSDGTLGSGRGLSPLDMTVLGVGNHHEGDDYVVTHVPANEVVQVAAALEAVDEAWMRQRYDRIDPTDYQGELSDEDFEYTWYWFTQVRDFYRKTAAAGRAVIFTVDQ